MTRLLVVAASLGLMVSTAGACGFKHSAHADVDPTVVASVAVEQAPPMSMPQTETSSEDASDSATNSAED